MLKRQARNSSSHRRVASEGSSMGRNRVLQEWEERARNSGGYVIATSGHGLSSTASLTVTKGNKGGVEDEVLPVEVRCRYERMRVLGRGSFGAVTLVKDTHDSRLYAMKTLPWGEKPEDKAHALMETKLLRSMLHPCIVALNDVFLSADGRLVCLIMTYCNSSDLAKVLAHANKYKTPIAEKQLLSWFGQICLGVEYLHRQHKVLHRDIKPQNLFLTESQRIIKIGDFGLAKVLVDPAVKIKSEVGTPYYTSPEMCGSKPYGYPSDVWSLGIVLYELMALMVPFRSRDVVELVRLVTYAAPPPLPHHYSPALAELVAWLLQKDPSRRPVIPQLLMHPLINRQVTHFVKTYKPINVAERQRRAESKELADQIAELTDATDVTIPEGLIEGAGGITKAEDSTPEASAPAGEKVAKPTTSTERRTIAGSSHQNNNNSGGKD
ncbi:unnamed protein product [Chrysoparadoxa australica]